MSALEGGEVLAFPGVKHDRDFPIGRPPRRPFDACKHSKSTVDPEAHTLSCDACGQLLDPWEVLDRWAREYDYIAGRFEAARREAAAAEKRLANLKAEEKRAKARVRSAEKATPADVLIADLARELYRLRQEGFPHRSNDEVALAAYREAVGRANDALQRALERDTGRAKDGAA